MKANPILPMGNMISLLILCLHHLCYSFSGNILVSLNLELNKEGREEQRVTWLAAQTQEPMADFGGEGLTNFIRKVSPPFCPSI